MPDMVRLYRRQARQMLAGSKFFLALCLGLLLTALVTASRAQWPETFSFLVHAYFAFIGRRVTLLEALDSADKAIAADSGLVAHDIHTRIRCSLRITGDETGSNP